MSRPEEEFSFIQLFIPLTTKKVVGIIFIVGLIVFFNALGNGFVWDDTAYILTNTDIHSFSLEKIFGSSYFNKDGYYRAIPALYFTILYGLFAKQAFFYHFFQILLHVTNTFLLFRFFKRFFIIEASLILSLLFLVHPINVESVSFIGATISPLFVFFGLCALQLLITKKPLTNVRYLGIVCFLFLSLLTKEGGILFFIVAALFAFLFQKGTIKKLLLYESLILPVYLFLRLALGKVYLTGIEASIFGQGSSASDGRFVPIMTLSLLERIMMMPSIFMYYLKTFFYPVALAVDQTWIITTLTFQSFYLPLFLSMLFFTLVCLFGWQLYLHTHSRFRPYLFFLGWFVIGMGMHLQLLALDMTVADRWFYFPSIGLLGMLFIVCEYYFSNNKKSTLFTLVIFLLLILSVRTMIRNANFFNEITLYENDRLVANNYEIELNLGSAYGQVGQLDRTLYHYQKSIELYPNEANLDSMGLFSEWKGNLPLATAYYEKALTARSFYLNPNKRLVITYTRLGYTYLKLQHLEKARDISLKGITYYPNEQQLWVQLAQSEYLLGKRKEAMTAAEKAKALKSTPLTEKLIEIIKTNQTLTID